MRFVDQMNKEEKKEFVKEWIENFKETRDFSNHENLKLAIDYFDKGDLGKAKNILVDLTKKYEIKVYDNFKELLNTLTIPEDKELEKKIKHYFSLDDTRAANYWLHQAIKEKKVQLTEDELKIVDEFARECT